MQQANEIEKRTNFHRSNESVTTYKTMQIHREYGSNDNPNSHMDLCFLTEEDIQEIDDSKLKKVKKIISPFIWY